MWKALAASFVVLLVAVGGTAIFLSDKIYLRDGHETVAPQSLDEAIAPDAIRDDLEFLVETLARNHPDFEAIGGARYAAAVRALGSTIDRPLTRLEIYRRLAPLNALLRDGHTGLEPPDEERDRYEAGGGRYPEFVVRLEDGQVRIARALDPGAPYPPGRRILSINGVSADELAAHSLATRSGESEALRRAYAEQRFYRDIVHAGISSPFRVMIEGAEAPVSSPGLTRSQYIERRDAGLAGYAFAALDARTGLITFSEMPSDLGPFRAFLRQTFSEVSERSLTRLIIDLRENGGGDSRAGDALMGYLTADVLPSVASVDVKVTEEIRAYYRTLLPDGFRWIPLRAFVPMLQQIETTPAGRSFTLHPPPSAPRPRGSRPAHAFDGEIMVLIGPRTYSSAVIFAAPLKHYGRAVFVGEETGEPLSFFGENYYFDLPHSRLQAVVSHKRFTLVGAGNDQRGIMPDVQTRADDALRAAQAL